MSASSTTQSRRKQDTQEFIQHKSKAEEPGSERKQHNPKQPQAKPYGKGGGNPRGRNSPAQPRPALRVRQGEREFLLCPMRREFSTKVCANTEQMAG